MPTETIVKALSPLTTLTIGEVTKALTIAKSELVAVTAARSEAQRVLAVGYVRGGAASSDPAAATARDREAFLRDAIAGLELLADEAAYVEATATITAGVGAIEVSHRSGISDARSAFREVHARRENLERKHPDFAQRYAAAGAR
jgi:hypothetical protein